MGAPGIRIAGAVGGHRFAQAIGRLRGAHAEMGGSRLPLRRLWTASADGFAGLPGLTNPRGWHVLARDAVARWVRRFAWGLPLSCLALPVASHRCQLTVWHARRCDQLVGEVLQAPPTVAVVRLLDEISDTVSLPEPSLTAVWQECVGFGWEINRWCCRPSHIPARHACCISVAPSAPAAFGCLCPAMHPTDPKHPCASPNCSCARC